MAKRVSATAIGIFVVGGIAVMITALVVLGSGRLFRKEHKFICFFQGSLNGLKVGAAIKVRGVQIGSVTDIFLKLPASQGKVRQEPLPLTGLPVIFVVDESQLKGRGGTGAALKSHELDALIKQGLRAQLATESFLTGLLYIDLDFHPGAPANFQLEPGSSRYREVPTIPTDLQQIQQSAMKAVAQLQNIDIGALAGSIVHAAASIDQLLAYPGLKPTLGSLKDTVENLNATVVAFRHVLGNVDAKAEPLLASLTKTSSQAKATLTQATSTLAQLQMTFAPDAPLTYRLNVALENLASASSALQQLANYLERNPSAVVRGKYVSESQK